MIKDTNKVHNSDQPNPRDAIHPERPSSEFLRENLSVDPDSRSSLSVAVLGRQWDAGPAGRERR
jgi:hypothetical protein